MNGETKTEETHLTRMCHSWGFRALFTFGTFVSGFDFDIQKKLVEVKHWSSIDRCFRVWQLVHCSTGVRNHNSYWPPTVVISSKCSTNDSVYLCVTLLANWLSPDNDVEVPTTTTEVNIDTRHLIINSKTLAWSRDGRNHNFVVVVVVVVVDTFHSQSEKSINDYDVRQTSGQIDIL